MVSIVTIVTSEPASYWVCWPGPISPDLQILAEPVHVSWRLWRCPLCSSLSP